MKIPTKSQLAYRFGEGVDLVSAILDLDYRVTIYPRSKYNLFKYEMQEISSTVKIRKYPEKLEKTDELVKYLENYKGEEGKIKDIEKRMYLDICKKYPDNEGTYYCFKVITIFFEKFMGDDLEWFPYNPGPFTSDELNPGDKDNDEEKYQKNARNAEVKDKKKIVIEFSGGSKKARFLHHEELVEKITSNCESYVDRNGILEIIIAHPTEDVAQADRKIKIKVTINDSKDQRKTDKEMEIELVRNGWKVTQLDNIAKRGTDEKADNLLIYQPVSPENTNNAVKDLQKICNQVISRHQDITYTFLEENGKYDKKTKDALEQYIFKFKSIKKGTDETKDYPYTLECMGEIGISQELNKHLKDEYLFEYKNNLGMIVDRNLLIGKKHEKSLKDTDGLWDLYENVVKKYINKVYDISEQYRTSNEAWFHNPDNSSHFKMGDVTLEEAKYQYTTGTGNLYRTKKNEANQDVPDMIAASTNIPMGEFLVHKKNANGRFKINHGGNIIWITLTDSEWKNRDDRNINENKGNFGTVFNGYDYSNYGIPYCLGGKNSLEKYRERLEEISEDIKNWNKYPENEYVDTNEYAGWPNNGKIVGSDCNGFVQNCITHIFFDERVDGKNYRIVPNHLISVYKYSTHNGINNVPGASPAGDMSSKALTINGKPYASSIPIDTDDDTIDRRNLMTRGDVIVRIGGNPSGHIVLVTVPEDNYPCAADRDNRNFAITHNYGGWTISTGNPAPNNTNNQSYFCKTIRSPFTAWNITWGGVFIGRIMLWK